MKMKIYFFMLIFTSSFLFVNAQYDKIKWENIGPEAVDLIDYNYVGRITSIIYNNYSQNFYLGSATGGFWKFSNNNENWKCTSENIPGGVKSIAINPKDSTNIFAIFSFYANGLKWNGHYSYGLFESKNGGDSWTKTSLNIEPSMMINLTKVVFDKIQQKKMYVLSNDRLYISNNLGKTWKLSSFKPNINENFENIVVFENGQIAISGKNCLYFSDIKQKNWQNKLPEYLIDENYVKISKSENVLWASIYLKSSDYILSTNDYGNSFTIKKNNNLSFKHYVHGLWTFNDSIIFAGGMFLYFSTDNANSFKKIKGRIHHDIRDVVFPNKNNYEEFYVATDGGVFYTKNLGKSWKIIGTMSLYQCYSVAVSDEDSCLILTGVHDNGTLLKNSEDKWYHILGGDGAGVAMSSTGKHRFAYITKYLRTFVNGKWKSIDARTNLLGVNPIQNPTYDNIYYVGTFSKTQKKVEILRSTNYGQSFQKIDEVSHHFSGDISAIAVAKSENEIIYVAKVGTWNKNYYNFQRIEIKDDTVINRKFFSEKTDKLVKISDIETHSLFSNTLWITYNGFDENKKISVSYNSGEDWKNLTYNLPNVPVYAVSYIGNLDLLIIGNDYGVFYLTDKKKWEKFGENLPLIAVTDFDYNNFTKELFIATYARGIWKIPLGN